MKAYNKKYATNKTGKVNHTAILQSNNNACVYNTSLRVEFVGYSVATQQTIL
jgi:hypothetical protein